MPSDDIALRRGGLAGLFEAPIATLRDRIGALGAAPGTPLEARIAALEDAVRQLSAAPTRVVPLGERLLALTHDGRKIFLDAADIGITPHIALTGEWERETEAVIRRLLRPGDAVVEVGANMGYHTLAMADAVGPAGHVHAFEANPAITPLLDATIQVNGLAGRVTLHPVAALAHRGEVEFAIHPSHCGSAHLAVPQDRPCYSRRATVPAIPLDEALGAGFGPAAMIRMDAEGSEPLVLRGAAWLLARSPAMSIVMEWAPHMMQAYADVAGFADWLAALGFRAARILPDASLQPLDRAGLLEAAHIEAVFRRDG
ncbi:FkbM family methyltransferase [Falsiroseomonas sp. CW058]|uniref:FkbM family methyltransferase n=1 Tax=Falsiroseomonas sp. CW058 TaxID=3388664 RepID=UPI003D321C27